MTPPAAAVTSGQRVARPATAPRRPRRVSGPAPARAPRRTIEPLGARVVARLRTLPDHRLLDRLVRGPAWIVLIGGALAGIVALQVSLLGLNAGIGRSIERSTVLERENGALEATNSRLSGGDRVEATAQRMGLSAASPGTVTFLSVRRGDAQRAIRALDSPRTPGTASSAAQSGPPPASATAPVTTASPPAAVTAPAATTTGAAGASTAPPAQSTPAAGAATTPATGTPATP